MSKEVNYQEMKQHVTVHADKEKPPEYLMDLADTHGVFACVVNHLVENIIIIDTADLQTVLYFRDTQGFDDLVLIQNPGAGSPGIGWRQAASGQPLVPPISVVSNDPTAAVTQVKLTYQDALNPNGVILVTALGKSTQVGLDAQGMGTFSINRPAVGLAPFDVDMGGIVTTVTPVLPQPKVAGEPLSSADS